MSLTDAELGKRCESDVLQAMYWCYPFLITSLKINSDLIPRAILHYRRFVASSRDCN